MADGDFYTAPEHGWVCFHCGEHFPATHQGVHDARRHFGTTPDHKPGCQIKLFDNDRRLLRTIRILEAQVARYQHERLDEDSEKDREIHGMRADHAQALIREEERGYARGLADYSQLSAAADALATRVLEFIADPKTVVDLERDMDLLAKASAILDLIDKPAPPAKPAAEQAADR